jgi:hypothetical protein
MNPKLKTAATVVGGTEGEVAWILPEERWWTDWRGRIVRAEYD